MMVAVITVKVIRRRRRSDGRIDRRRHRLGLCAEPRRSTGRATCPSPARRPPSERLWPVSISTVVLMPTRSGGSPSRQVTAMRTGMRCTTFTQLPVAFCGGSTANSAPVAWAMLSHRAGADRVGIGVDVDRGLLARPHARELGLLEVGLDPEVGVGHDDHHRHAGGGVAARHRSLGDDAVERRFDGGAAELQQRLVARRHHLLHLGMIVGADLGIAGQRRLDARAGPPRPPRCAGARRRARGALPRASGSRRSSFRPAPTGARTRPRRRSAG